MIYYVVVAINWNERLKYWIDVRKISMLKSVYYYINNEFITIVVSRTDFDILFKCKFIWDYSSYTNI